MRERPILFSGPMVRAILEGRKTVTRRVIKVQPHGLGAWIRQGIKWMFPNVCPHTTVNCPYGQPGDRMWVREAWAADAQLDSIPPRDLSQGEPILYQADGALRQTGCSMVAKGKQRPAIFMPRWASRILLEITDVRVERLQDISNVQARAEGYPADREAETGGSDLDAWLWFRSLWGEINGPEAFAANPWVWVVEFKRIQP